MQSVIIEPFREEEFVSKTDWEYFERYAIRGEDVVPKLSKEGAYEYPCFHLPVPKDKDQYRYSVAVAGGADLYGFVNGLDYTFSRFLAAPNVAFLNPTSKDFLPSVKVRNNGEKITSQIYPGACDAYLRLLASMAPVIRLELKFAFLSDSYTAGLGFTYSGRELTIVTDANPKGFKVHQHDAGSKTSYTFEGSSTREFTMPSCPPLPQ